MVASELETKHDFAGGYTGRRLRVDLSARQITVEDTPDVHKWLGPRGWHALIAWNETGPSVGPFDPQNRIIFSAGPLGGTCAPTAGRTTVSTIMPRGYPLPMWSSASMGGYLGAELKYAGYDSIIIQGQADAPCYLLVEDDKVSLQDARDLWGQGVYTTERALKARHSARHQIAAIGPAGENRVRFAAIIHRLSNAVGNGGFGGVMGAKNLKAIVVRGTRGVAIADPDGFMRAVEHVWGIAKGGIGRVGKIEQGFPNVACTHACTVRCGARIIPIKDHYGAGSPLNMSKCVDSSWAGGSHPEYRGVSLKGEQLYIPKPPGLGELGTNLANLANDVGITTWAYDTWYRYLAGLEQLGIHDVCGEPFELANPDWWRDWILKVAHREGLGDDMAEGLARFYDKHQVGPRYLADFIEDAGSRGHGWHRDGRAMEPHPSPFWEYAALLYAISTRDVTPSTHDFFFLQGLYGHPKTPKDPAEVSPQFKALAERLFGTRTAALPGPDVTEIVTTWCQRRTIIKDSLVLCDWVFPLMKRNYDSREQMLADTEGDLYGDVAAEATLYRTCTGIDMDIAEMENPVAERILALERCVEVRNNGRNRQADEAVIPHFQWPEKTDGTHLSADAHEFHALLDRYYTLHGWDPRTGCPTRATLEDLDLAGVAAGLPDQAS